jgi:CubicO group peptidase (beta-lactamase class C family)
MNQATSPKWLLWQIFAFRALSLLKPIRYSILVTSFLFYGGNTAFAQAIDSATAKKIDGQFLQIKKTSPGCAIGIVRNDTLIYAKGYGLANLEYGVPINTRTIFEMGSISKQFTAYAILLLARQGKLSIDDDIHKYLSWLPDFGKKICISNLLYHTSGIRDYDQLLAMVGTTQEDVITREHLIKILSRQQTLNFVPGEQYMYSNSGYFLLGEIVRAVTGESLRQFTDSAIFKPLGMNSTNFHDDYTEMVPNRAYPYVQANTMGIINSSVVGAKGLFTSIDDMSKWAINFFNSKSESYQIIAQMMQSGKLNSGKETGVGAGLQTDDYRGLKMYLHGGINGGYNNFIMFLPEVKMAFFIFSNAGNSNYAGKTTHVADLFIKDTRPEKEKPGFKTPFDPIVKDTTSVQPLLGSYVVDDGDHTAFKLKDRKFYYVLNGRQTFILYRTERDTFWFRGFYPGIKFVFTVKNAHNVTVTQTWPDGRSRTMRKRDPFNTPADKQLMAYAGKYYCSELECSYGIILKDHQLVLTNAKYPDSPLVFYSPTRMINTLDWMKSLDFTKDKKGKITGFDVNYNLVQDVRFEKIE